MNIRVIRYWVFFVGLLILSYATQVFVQNFNIQNKIETLKQTQSTLSWDSLWMETYYKKFLASDYSKLIFSHKNGITIWNEILVQIKTSDFNTSGEDLLDSYNKINKNNLEWGSFFQDIISKAWF